MTPFTDKKFSQFKMVTNHGLNRKDSLIFAVGIMSRSKLDKHV